MKIIGCIRFEEALLLVAAVFLFARGAPLTSQQEKLVKDEATGTKADSTVNKSKSEAAAKTEVKDSHTDSTASTPTTPKTVVKSPEVAEPPEIHLSGAAEKRSSVHSEADSQVSADSVKDDMTYDNLRPLAMNFEGDHDVGGPMKDEDFYLRAILSDPQLVRDIMTEETRLRDFQQVPPEMDVDLKPSSMAWYLLATGDIEGVTRMINALVAYGALNVEEARDYRMAVEEEYAQLTQTGMGGLSYPVEPLSGQSYEREVDYTAALPYPVGIPAFPLPVEFDEGPGDYQQNLSPYGEPVVDQQRLEDEYYYDGVMKELLEAMVQENQLEEELKKENSLASKQGSKLTETDQKTSGTGVASSGTSLVEELEGLYPTVEKEGSEERAAPAPEVDMSVEEQLEQLLSGSHASADQSLYGSETKQRQANRTKPQQPLGSKTNEKKDNEKKA